MTRFGGAIAFFLIKKNGTANGRKVLVLTKTLIEEEKKRTCGVTNSHTSSGWPSSNGAKNKQREAGQAAVAAAAAMSGGDFSPSRTVNLSRNTELKFRSS